MNTVVLYQSRYGSTKQYAEWIAEELGADIYPADSFPAEKFARYDTVIFGAPVFGGAVLGVAGIENNLAVLQNKRLIIFTVGLTSPEAEESLSNLAAKNFSAALQKHAKFFHLRGALEYRKLSFGHKILLRMIRSSMPNKLDLNQNHVSREAVLPLVAAAGGDFPE